MQHARRPRLVEAPVVRPVRLPIAVARQDTVSKQQARAIKFLGLVIVRALSELHAVAVSHLLGLNPGGEILIVPIDECAATRLTFDLEPYMNRLIPKPESLGLSARIELELCK